MDSVEKRVAYGKTRVKTWNEWVESDEGKKCLDGSAQGEYLKNRLWYAFMAGVDVHEDSLIAAERRQEWIKVTPETMPPIGKYVNVVCNGVVQFNAAQFTGVCWEWYPEDEFDPAPKDEVTHWQPLPAPPEEVDSHERR